MKHKKFFLLATEDRVIIVNAEEDGVLVMYPETSLDIIEYERHPVPTGSEDGKRTFAPGVAQKLVFSLETPGPVEKHQLCSILKEEWEAIMAMGCSTIQAEIDQLLKDNLTPKQKKEELSADEPASEGHTE